MDDLGDLEEARVFARGFVEGLKGEGNLQGEVLSAMGDCLKRYDTGPFENRFGVGGVMEQILGSAARALGFTVNNAGAHLQKYDLELRPGYGVSVKASFGAYSRSSRVRLTNSQGAIGEWDTGTLFILTGVGIGYADRELVGGATLTAGDGKSLDIAVLPLLHFWGLVPRAQKGNPPTWLSSMTMPTHQPGYFVPLDIPDRSSVRSPRLISDPIALDILQSGHSPTLLREFRWSV
jgi:hypothetical protein